MKEDLEKVEKEQMKEEKEERKVEKGEEQEKEEEGEWEMCTKCLEIGKNVHKSVDCMEKQIINAGYKLAVCMKSQNLKKMLELIDTTEEERCPVCQGDCKDFNMCLKHEKFIKDGDNFCIEGVEKCGKCGGQHPYNIPKKGQK